MSYLAGIKKVTALIAEQAHPLVALRAIIEASVEFAHGNSAELCIPPDRLEAMSESQDQSSLEEALGDKVKITASESALEYATKAKRQGDPVTFEEDSQVVLTISCGTLTIFKPKIDTSLYTDQVLILKIMADLADDVIQKSLGDSIRQLRAAKKENHRLLQRNMALRELAMFDDLTGLYNKRFFKHCLESELFRLSRYGRAFGVALVAVDFLEDLNSRLGHAVGDAALYHAGKMGGQQVRKGDIIARWHEGSFAVLFPETNLAVSMELAELIRTEIDKHPVVFDNGELHISVSVGVMKIADGFEKTATDIMRSLQDALARQGIPDHNRVISVI